MNQIQKENNKESEDKENKKKSHSKKKKQLTKTEISHSKEDAFNKEEQTRNKTKFNQLSKDLIAENFVLLTEIGHGAFGQIFLSFSIRDNTEVAIKKENKRSERSPQLKNEAKVYQTLLNIPPSIDLTGINSIGQQDHQGVTKFYGYGELDDCYYLIIEFLGPNLIELLNYCGNKKFSVVTVCLLALQMINRVEYLHQNHYIHRDIKPENFVIGSDDNSNVIYLIDFGLSKRYKNSKNHQHIPYREGRFLTGTARYVSINMHLGIEQSRRDDLESIGYVLVYFLKGSLPWQGLKGKNARYARIMEKKLQIPTEILCFGLPEEFTTYLNYCKSLKFEDKPDYNYIRGLFLSVLSSGLYNYGITNENLRFDWSFEDMNVVKNLISLTKADGSPKGDPSALDKGIRMKVNNFSVKNENKKENNEDNINNIENNVENDVSNDVKNVKENEKDKYNGDSNVNNTQNVSQSKDTSSNAKESDDNTIELAFDGKHQASLLNTTNEREKDINHNIINNNIQSKEIIDKYIDALITECKAPKNRKISHSITSINNQSHGDDDITIEMEHECSKDIFKILNKLKLNNHNRGSEKFFTFDPFKLNKKDTENSKFNEFTFCKNPKVITNQTKTNTLKELFNSQSPSFKSNSLSSFKKKTKESMEKILNRFNHKSSKRIISQFKEEIDKMKLAKENLIKISKEPVSKYYEILSDLGEGSFGKVKKVKHKKLNELRAMKIVNKRTPSSKNEIAVLRKISHPNIMNIFEIFEDNRQYYIMSEFCEGGELFDAITSKGFYNEMDAAKIIKQILLAVNYLHNEGIVHRDLKPENIMLLSNNLDLKLIDFGTAVEIPKSGKRLTKFIGTSYYIAPEVIQQSYNEKCDVWSCGIILYILLCGYPPFNGSSNHQIYNAIQFAQLQFSQEEWREISNEPIELIRHMLNKDPNQRPSAQECLKNKWINTESNKGSKSDLAIIENNKVSIIERMVVFVEQNKFKQAVLQYISTEFNLKREEEDLRNMFKEFDVNDKGVLSKDVFIQVIQQIEGAGNSTEFLNEIFNKIDLDGSGSISYNEFLTSIINSKKILTEDRLEKAFKMFDKDENGLLSVEEIKTVFGGDEELWKKVFKEVDKNGDGEVDFEEFKSLMIGFDPNEIVG